MESPTLSQVFTFLPCSQPRVLLPIPDSSHCRRVSASPAVSSEVTGGEAPHSSEVRPCGVGAYHPRAGFREASVGRPSRGITELTLTAGPGPMAKFIATCAGQGMPARSHCPHTCPSITLSTKYSHVSKPWNSKVTELREEPVTLFLKFLFSVRG